MEYSIYHIFLQVRFNYPDTKPFEEACKPLHEAMLKEIPELQETYDAIQEYNEAYPAVVE